MITTHHPSDRPLPRTRRHAHRRARNSTCGDASLARCCVYASDDDEVGRCRLMTESACDAIDDRTDLANEEGPGSCVPNPCAF